MSVSDCPHCDKSRKIEEGHGLHYDGGGYTFDFVLCTNGKCDAPDLLRCPFCLGKAYIGQRRDTHGLYSYYVFCANCKGQSDVFINSDCAEDRWNRRNTRWKWEQEIELIAERDALKARVVVLEDAIIEHVEVATLREDNDIPMPPDDPRLWSARMGSSWQELERIATEALKDGREMKTLRGFIMPDRTLEEIHEYVNLMASQEAEKTIADLRKECDELRNIIISIKHHMELVGGPMAKFSSICQMANSVVK